MQIAAVHFVTTIHVYGIKMLLTECLPFSFQMCLYGSNVGSAFTNEPQSEKAAKRENRSPGFPIDLVQYKPA